MEGRKLATLTAYMSNISLEDIERMVAANSHNKYMTLYSELKVDFGF